MKGSIHFLFFLVYFFPLSINSSSIPLVINTWKFTQATEEAWKVLKKQGTSAVDAITMGCSACEVAQCDRTVGYGGSPDEHGETTLDALIFDGATMDMGAVGGLRRIKNAISVARHVLEHTTHSLLVGDLATEFATKNFHYPEESLSTNFSQNVWQRWRNVLNCQPNYWKNVSPDPTTSCGPYQITSTNNVFWQNSYNSHNHDTIGMIAIDAIGNVAAGTSTNGAKYKIPGRVGDSPIPGAGAYADNEVGAAVATGDGDVMMRFLPSFLAVEEMRRGATPRLAAKIAIERIARKYPMFFGAVVAVSNKGEFSAACNGMKTFPYAVAGNRIENVMLLNVTCTNPS